MTTLLKKAVGRTLSGFTKELQKEWTGPFTFIQGADTQLGMIDSYILKKPIEDIGWEEDLRLLNQAIASVNAMTPQPRFFIVCGDLIDAFPGTMHRLAQEQDFIKAFSALKPEIPLVCVCGNHDIGDTPTRESIENYNKVFGDDYFTFYCAGVMFIVINSSFYKDISQVEELAKKHDEWLDNQLKEAKEGKYKHVIIFQHIPWFLKSPDEEDQYFNVLTELRKKMLQKFYDANVRAIFCGHYHRNAGGFYKDLELVVTSAIGAQLGNDKSGFRVVKVLDKVVEHNYYPLDQVPLKINL